jgi:hypothetical protein
MRTMYDWSAGRWQGITDRAELALAQAESHLGLGESARVEKVSSVNGHSTGIGVGWTATLAEHGPTSWVPFGWVPEPLALPAAGA